MHSQTLIQKSSMKSRYAPQILNITGNDQDQCWLVRIA
jgi:hypothetical protein